MNRGRKAAGVLGEEIARKFLVKKGYRIIHKNFTCALGEIDVVARDKGVIVFVEIRSTCSVFYESPAESLLWKKRRKLTMLANFYIKKFNLENESLRFDVISVVRKTGVLDIKLIKDAFWEV